LLENNIKSKIDVSQIIKNHKKIISIFPGSRKSEIDILLPILMDFIKLMNKKYDDFFYVFHSTSDFNKSIQDKLLKEGFKNCGSISNEKIKSEVLKSSSFAVAKSGTISLEICNAKVPSIIIYKMSFLNFLIIKMLVKVKYANIINIAADEEIIPELLQSNCNSKNIFRFVDNFFNDSKSMQNQINKSQEVLKNFKINQSTDIAASVLTDCL
jgi:lipid-A-disaccharide synthase